MGILYLLFLAFLKIFIGFVFSFFVASLLVFIFLRAKGILRTSDF